MGPPGFHTTAREPKRAHLTVQELQTPPKFHEKTPERKERNLRREREKKERNFGQSGGGRSGTEVFIHNLDLAEFRGLDGRRIEVIADALTCSKAPNLPSTQRLCHHSAETASRDAELLDAQVWHWNRHAGRRRPLSWNESRTRLVLLAAKTGVARQLRLQNSCMAKAETAPVLMQTSWRAAAGPSHCPLLRGVHSSLLSRRFCGRPVWLTCFCVQVRALICD